MYKKVVVESDGSGAGSTALTENPRGFLRGIRLDYGGTPEVATHVVIDEKGDNSLLRTILDVTTGTPASYAPQDEIQDSTGADQTLFTPFYFEGDVELTVTVSGADASQSDAVTALFLFSER